MPPYELYLNNTQVQTFSDMIQISSLVANMYQVLIIDQNGCFNEVEINLEEPEPLVLTGAIIDDTPVGGMAGMISPIITGGVLPYTYLWSNGATTESIANLAEGTYSCIVTDANGCTLETPAFEIKATSSIKNLPKIIDWSLYPNPVIDWLNYELQLDKQTNIQINLFDALGRLVYTKQEDFSTQYKGQINVTNFSSGVYLFEITDGDQLQITERVVLNE